MARRKRQIATNKSARADRQSGSGQADRGAQTGKADRRAWAVVASRLSRPSPLASPLERRLSPFLPWLFAAAMVAAVFLAYSPVWTGARAAGFIWDDDLHLLNNPVLQPGGWLTTWVPGSYVNYWPVTFTAYRLQYALWGLDPRGFHLVNLAVHAGAALLVWRVLTRLRARGHRLAAALFALHPVNVESAAWVAQLKATLSLLLTLRLAALVPVVRAGEEGDRHLLPERPPGAAGLLSQRPSGCWQKGAPPSPSGHWRYVLSLGIFLGRRA